MAGRGLACLGAAWRGEAGVRFGENVAASRRKLCRTDGCRRWQHVGRRRTKSTSPGVLLFTVTSTLTRHEVEHLVAGKTGGVLQGYRHVPVVP